MSIKYIIVPHKIPSKPDEPVRYYPRLKSSDDRKADSKYPALLSRR